MLLFAVEDDGSRSLTNKSRVCLVALIPTVRFEANGSFNDQNALESLGARDFRPLGNRESYCLIVVVGWVVIEHVLCCCPLIAHEALQSRRPHIRDKNADSNRTSLVSNGYVWLHSLQFNDMRAGQ